MRARVWSRRRHGHRSTRWSARVAVIVGAAVVMLALVAPTAGANYGRITATVGCDRNVAWTASASTEGTPDERTNNRVLVEYRASSAGAPSGDWTPAGPEGRFDPTNDFQFSGSFPLPGDADAADLRVTPLANWGPDGEGESPGGPRFSRVTLPAECADQPIVASSVADCANGGARVSVRNTGDVAQTVTVSADGVALRALQLAPDAAQELVVPLLDGHPSVIRVAAGDFVVSEGSVDAECGIVGPAAIVLERCPTRQAVVFATLGDRTDGAIQIRVAGTIVHAADMQATALTQHSLALPATGATPIEVSVDGTISTVGEVGGCDGPVAGTVTCGVPGRAACAVEPAIDVPPPPPPPPPLVMEFDDPPLPQTGPWERAIALLVGGVLLVAGGTAIATQDRRRPVHSTVAAAVAPYRQRWWDDT